MPRLNTRILSLLVLVFLFGLFSASALGQLEENKGDPIKCSAFTLGDCSKHSECKVEYTNSSWWKFFSASQVCVNKCPVLECANPPQGCNYEAGVDSNGCPSCGEVVCSGTGDLSGSDLTILELKNLVISLQRQVQDLQSQVDTLTKSGGDGGTTPPITGALATHINSISFTSGQIGKIVTIHGYGFVNTPYVNSIFLGDHIILNAASSDGTSLTFTVPSSFSQTCQVSPCPATAGKPVLPGLYKVYVENKDGSSNQVDFTVTPTVESAPPLITTASLPDATVGQPYSASILASDGSGDYTWSYKSGTAPYGLQFNNPIFSCGNSDPCRLPFVISGTPSYPGTYTFTVQVSAAGVITTKTYTITVKGVYTGPLTITTQTLPDAVAGEPYGSVISASGGIGFYSWQRTSGSLPSAMMTAADGTPRYMIVEGTPIQAGTSTFTVQVTSGQETATRTFTLNVATPSVPQITDLSTTSGPAGSTVTVNGVGFVNNPSVNTVFMGNKVIYNAPSPSGTSFSFIVPTSNPQPCQVSPCLVVSKTPLAPGVYKIFVANKNGNSNEVEFTVTS